MLMKRKRKAEVQMQRQNNVGEMMEKDPKK